MHGVRVLVLVPTLTCAGCAAVYPVFPDRLQFLVLLDHSKGP